MMPTRHIAAAGALIAVVGFVLYLPALGAGFVYDDVYLVSQQTCFRSLGNIPGFFAAPYDACDYRPLRYVSYAIDYAIGGDAPWIYHLTNLWMHALCVWFGWLLLGHMAGWRSRSEPSLLWLGAAALGIYALHPALADAVVPVAGRRDVQSTCLYLAALWAWVRRGEGWKGQAGWVGLCVLLWVTALLSKEMAITLPAAVVLVEVFAPGEDEPVERIKALVRRFWPLLLVVVLGTVAFGIYRGFLVSHSNMKGRWWGGGPLNNLLNVVAIQAEYARLVFWPAVLLGDYAQYTLPVMRDPWHWRFWAGLSVWLGAAFGSLWGMRTGRRLVAFGLAWYLVTILPVSHLIPHHEMVAEHFLHLPMLGLVIALYGAFEGLVLRGGFGAQVAVAAVAILLVLSAARLQLRIPDFTDDRHFGLNILAEAPGNVRNLGRLAAWHLEQTPPDFEGAEPFAWMQYRTSPPGTVYHTAATQRLALIYERLYDDPDRAATVLRESLEAGGDNAVASDLVALYMRFERPDAAIPVLETMIDLAPKSFRPQVDLGFARLMEGDLAGAGQAADIALKLAPDEAEPSFLLANVLAAQGKMREAFGAYEAVLVRQPEHLGALMASADMLCALGRKDEGLRRARRAQALVPGDEGVEALIRGCGQ